MWGVGVSRVWGDRGCGGRSHSINISNNNKKLNSDHNADYSKESGNIAQVVWVLDIGGRDYLAVGIEWKGNFWKILLRLIYTKASNTPMLTYMLHQRVLVFAITARDLCCRRGLRLHWACPRRWVWASSRRPWTKTGAHADTRIYISTSTQQANLRAHVRLHIHTHTRHTASGGSKSFSLLLLHGSPLQTKHISPFNFWKSETLNQKLHLYFTWVNHIAPRRGWLPGCHR